MPQDKFYVKTPMACLLVRWQDQQVQDYGATMALQLQESASHIDRLSVENTWPGNRFFLLQYLNHPFRDGLIEDRLKEDEKGVEIKEDIPIFGNKEQTIKIF